MYYKVAHSQKEKQTRIQCSKGLAPVHKLIKEMPYSSTKDLFRSLMMSAGTHQMVSELSEGINKDGIFWTYSYSSLAKERWLDLKAIIVRHAGFVFASSVWY